MDEQLSLFESNSLNENKLKFQIIEGKKKEKKDFDKLKCYKSELKEVSFLTKEELFSGYNTIKAITFSYDIGFINKIMENFDYGEIILGGTFLSLKDKKLNNLLAEVMTNVYEAGTMIKKYEKLINLMKNDSLFFKTPTFTIDHRKIYLLKSDAGNTRVIRTSANMTGRAWNGEWLDFFEYDDTPYCYEEYEKDFETAWLNSEEIPLSIVSSKVTDDLIGGNAVLKGVKETGKTIVFQQPDTKQPFFFDNIKYVIDHEKIRSEYQMLLNNIETSTKKGVFSISPKELIKVEHNRKKIIQQKIKNNTITEQYPEMMLDLYENTASIGGKCMDLNPSPEEVRNDINELNEIFCNFDEFVGDTKKLKSAHFKIINAIFVSPFHARLRCTAQICGIPTNSLPLFLLVVSDQANCGKTFTISVALKMMTGKNLTVFNKEECSTSVIRDMQLGVKCTPVFIDEVTNMSMKYIKDIIKHPEKCEENQIEDMPMIIFASNDCTDMDEILRKRMIFLKLKGGLPSSIDQSAYKGKGNAIKKRLGTGFYRVYLRKIMPRIKEIQEYMIQGENIPDGYYPDLMALSSEVIRSIYIDYGCEIPDYVKNLTWNEDYSVNANFIIDETIEEIKTFYKQNKKAFIINKNTVFIELGNDADSKKRFKSWLNTLPREMEASSRFIKEGYSIMINRDELEKRLGFQFKSHFFQKNI